MMFTCFNVLHLRLIHHISSRSSALLRRYKSGLKTSGLALVASLVCVTACAPPDDEDHVPDVGQGTTSGSSTGTAGGEQAGGDQAGGSTGSAGSSDLPCDVGHLLATYCAACHGRGTAMPLTSRAELMAPSMIDPTLSRAQKSVQRFLATDGLRMPPSPLPEPTVEEIQAFQDWVDAGAMSGTCADATDGIDTPSPYDTPSVCSSDKLWTKGNEESPRMNPGQECISCHTEEREGPRFLVAGTLYPTAHEPDNCNGTTASSSLYVEITDADGAVYNLKPNSAGNFFLEEARNFKLPYTARVVSGDEERVMLSPQDDGDCNSCHSENGDNLAPGRVMAP